MERAFEPAWGDATSVSNATSATAAVVLPKTCQQVVLTNKSSSATVNVMLTRYLDESDPPTGTAPTTSSGLAVLPSSQIRITVGPGHKLLRTIASAADGTIEILPGNGI